MLQNKGYSFNREVAHGTIVETIKQYTTNMGFAGDYVEQQLLKLTRATNLPSGLKKPIGKHLLATHPISLQQKKHLILAKRFGWAEHTVRFSVQFNTLSSLMQMVARARWTRN